MDDLRPSGPRAREWQPFDPHATGYDDVALSALGVELRNRVHAVVSDLLRPTTSALDLGCGTGVDAAWLASRAAGVVGLDPSAAMVERARQRCAQLPNVLIEQGTLDDLGDRAASFDLVLTNFGAINCVDDLGVAFERIAEILVDGGSAVVVTMTRWCPIELLVGLVTLNEGLLRRRRPGRATGDYAVEVNYASARDLAQRARPHFAVRHAEALGVALPPFEQRAWIEGRPRLRRALAAVDDVISPLGARFGIGDHHIVVLERKGQT